MCIWMWFWKENFVLHVLPHVSQIKRGGKFKWKHISWFLRPPAKANTLSQPGLPHSKLVWKCAICIWLRSLFLLLSPLEQCPQSNLLSIWESSLWWSNPLLFDYTFWQISQACFTFIIFCKKWIFLICILRPLLREKLLSQKSQLSLTFFHFHSL